MIEVEHSVVIRVISSEDHQLVRAAPSAEFWYLKGKYEKGKACVYTHCKTGLSKVDLEFHRKITKRRAAAGVVLGSDRSKVVLAPVEELIAETEEWIWDTSAALVAVSAVVAGNREVSFARPIIDCRWCLRLEPNLL